MKLLAHTINEVWPWLRQDCANIRQMLMLGGDGCWKLTGNSAMRMPVLIDKGNSIGSDREEGKEKGDCHKRT